jgi:hypothetical protein
MISTKDFDSTLRNLGQEYFVFDIMYVDDIGSWARSEKIDLNDPLQLMKLAPGEGSGLIMVVQNMISEEMLNDNMKGLSVRWALKSTASHPEKMLNSTKKQLAFFFLKEYAQTVRDVGGDVMIEDDWAIREMEKLGFFTE